METIDLKNMSPAQLRELEQKLKEEKSRTSTLRRDAYEGLRSELVHSIFNKVTPVTSDVEELYKFVEEETAAFKTIMADYGQLRRDDQMSFRLQDGDKRIEVKTNKVKKFDERADVAASRLIEFLQEWINNADGGRENPMYQLAMVLLDRNKDGDLDYKNISKLYQLEANFNDIEYSAIMDLFRESHLVEGTATRFYFYRRDVRGVWRKVEPSFNKM